ERSLRAFESAPEGAMLFGIAQGGDVPELRRISARSMVETGFHGYAVGGLAVGEPQAVMLAMIEEAVPLLPSDRPRYLMGVGTPADLVGAVLRGVDMFDCVMPTRAGRTARAFVPDGTLNLRNAVHADDPGVVEPGCPCPACTRHSRAYLHHLFKAGEMLGPMLLTWHNLTHYQRLMAGLRAAIVHGRVREHAAMVLARLVPKEAA
ncbi:MAG: tRNA-guanine transglycosylase, partial [Acetobacteraceae bacterium]|nr:tRNA-guanine transglycosylase [Acetobacteraceae bacterium]